MRWYFQMILKAAMPCYTYRGGQKVLGVSCQCALGKEGFSLPGSLIRSALARCMSGTLERQRGEEACSETADLLQGREGLCVQGTPLALLTTARHGQETAKGREKNCTWWFPGILFKEAPSISSSLRYASALPFSSQSSSDSPSCSFRGTSELLDGTPLLRPCRDLCLSSVCLCYSCSGLPKGRFLCLVSPARALFCGIACGPAPQLLVPLSWDPQGPPVPLLLPSFLSPTSDLQQRAGCSLWCHHCTLKVCVRDQRALIRIVLSVSELTGLRMSWGLTLSGCNFPHSGIFFLLLPEYPPAVWDLLGWSDQQCQLPTSQPVLDTRRRGQPRFPGCWHCLLSSPFLPRLAQLGVWFYFWRHLRLYNHNQLLHLCPTGMLSPLFPNLAGNGLVFRVSTTAAMWAKAFIFLLLSPNTWAHLPSSKPPVVLLPQANLPSLQRVQTLGRAAAQKPSCKNMPRVAATQRAHVEARQLLPSFSSMWVVGSVLHAVVLSSYLTHPLPPRVSAHGRDGARL